MLLLSIVVYVRYRLLSEMNTDYTVLVLLIDCYVNVVTVFVIYVSVCLIMNLSLPLVGTGLDSDYCIYVWKSLIINHDCGRKMMPMSAIDIGFVCDVLYSIIFRFVSSVELLEYARSRIECRRASVSCPQDTILNPQPVNQSDYLWGERNKLSKSNIIREICGRKPTIGYRDEDCMTRYLSKVKRDSLNDVQLSSWSEFLPTGAPLLDFLAVDSEKVGSWKFPSGELISDFRRDRGLSLRMLGEVVVKEIIVGVTSNDEVRETAQWMMRMHDRDQAKFPSGMISMDVEEVPGTLFDWLRLAGKLSFVAGQKLQKKAVSWKVDNLSDKNVQIPVRLMLGNGITWSVQILLNLGRDGHDYILKSNVPQPALIKLLRDLPVCVGLGVKSDVDEIELFYSMLTGCDVLLNGFIDLAVLATLSGWEFQSRGMTAMGVQVYGTVLNKCVSTADYSWAVPWPCIQRSLKVYALGDLKFGYLTHIILLGVLIRDVFPDPEVVCAFTQCYQCDVVKWFCRLVRSTLRDVELHPNLVKTASSRRSLINCFRVRTGAGGDYASSPPVKSLLWIELLGKWPSITNGGCRWLLEARDWFISQVDVLVRFEVDGPTGPFHLMEESDRQYARFGFPSEVLDSIDWSASSSCPGLELARPKELLTMVVHKRVDQLAGNKISRYCDLGVRCHRDVVYEWARMMLSEVGAFMEKLLCGGDFSNWYSSHYDGVRLIYLRATNCPTLEVPRIEADIERKNEELIAQEELLLARCSEELESRSRRVEWLKCALQKGGRVERSSWRHQLPDLPDWKRKVSKRRRSRSRSRSRGRSRSVKRRCTRSMQVASVEIVEEIINEVPPQVSAGDNVVRDKNTRDVVLVDDPDLEEVSDAPLDECSVSGGVSSEMKCRLKKMMIPSKKGKRGKKPAVLLSYAEMMEPRPLFTDSDSDELHINAVVDEIDEFLNS